MGRHAWTLVLSALACLLGVSPAAAQAPAPVPKMVEIADRDARATCRYATARAECQPEASAGAVDAFEGSWAHRALVFQHSLGDDVGFGDAPWAATHNSYNSIAEMGPALSALDSNHQLTLRDQLRIGIRSLEIDVHRFRGENVVCHARGANEGHAGCSVEKELAATLAPVVAWVEEHPGHVLMLYLEDHMGDAAGYDEAAATVRAAFGDALYAPSPGAGTGCQVLPTALTRDDVLAAGASVFVVSDCGPGSGWRTVAFDWGPMHDEAQPDAFDPQTCGPFARARLSRFYEDSTGLSYGVARASGDAEPAKMTPAITRAMVRCGIDHIGFDQLVPGDGRLDALMWSWRSGEPSSSGDCAVQGSDGRWSAGSCSTKRRVACRAPSGAWSVSRKPAFARRAARACPDGTRPATPRTGYENAQLRAAARDEPVLLALQRTGTTWHPTDPR